MVSAPESLRDFATLVGLLALGAVGTAAGALAVLFVSPPLQPALYDAAYLRLGPTDATFVAILGHFLLAGTAALAAPALVVAAVDHGVTPRTVSAVVTAVVCAPVGFFLLAFVGLHPVLAALLVFAAVVVAPVAVRRRFDVGSRPLTAYVGGLPVLLFLLVLAGFGLGWGWGYVVTAQAVPAAPADAVDFAQAPAVRDALLSGGNCETNATGARTCRLELRGSPQEVAAVRFLGRHGARCPYQGTSEAGGSFLARANGTVYRVGCQPHGD